MTQALDELRAALSRHAYLVGDGLSLAHVATATALQFIEPVSARYIRLGPATRSARFITLREGAL